MRCAKLQKLIPQLLHCKMNFSKSLALVTLLVSSSALGAVAQKATETTLAPTSCIGFCKQDWTTLINVGAGLPAVSVRFDGKLGFANAVAPIEMGLNLMQYIYHPTEQNAAAGSHKFSFARVALGLTVTKAPDTSDITFGGYLVPLGVQIDSFAFGVGIAYSAVGSVTNNSQNWSVVVPFSYNISLGN
jgi:hypothetical protein